MWLLCWKGSVVIVLEGECGDCVGRGVCDCVGKGVW